MSAFLDDLRALLNRHSAESHSNTPDFILAAFLSNCLSAWGAGVNARDKWYQRADTADPSDEE